MECCDPIPFLSKPSDGAVHRSECSEVSNDTRDERDTLLHFIKSIHKVFPGRGNMLNMPGQDLATRSSISIVWIWSSVPCCVWICATNNIHTVSHKQHDDMLMSLLKTHTHTHTHKQAPPKHGVQNNANQNGVSVGAWPCTMNIDKHNLLDNRIAVELWGGHQLTPPG